MKKIVFSFLLVSALMLESFSVRAEELSRKESYSVMGGDGNYQTTQKADYYVRSNGEKESDVYYLENRLCVRVGEGIGAESGQYLDLVLETGETVPCIVSGIDKGSDKAVSSIISDSTEKSLSLADIDKNWKGAVTEVVIYEEGYECEIGTDVVNYALQFVGNPYVWGGTSLTDGADCSGFILSLFSRYGISLPHDAAAQSGYGVSVSASELKPGDLIFYDDDEGVINHVSLYIGEGKIVHASNPDDGIKISYYNYREPACIRRLF